MIKLISYKSIVKYNGHTIDDINKALLAKSQQNNADYIARTERQGQPTPIFVPLTKLQQEYQRRKASCLYMKPLGKFLQTDTDSLYATEKILPAEMSWKISRLNKCKKCKRPIYNQQYQQLTLNLYSEVCMCWVDKLWIL